MTQQQALAGLAEAVTKDESMHDDRTVIAREEDIDRVAARDLSVKYIGRKVEVLGELMELRKFGFKGGAEGSRVELWLDRWLLDVPRGAPCPESLFWDVNAESVLRFQVRDIPCADVSSASVTPSCWSLLVRWVRRIWR